MATPLFQLKQQIVDACHRVYNKDWVASNDGNLSARIDKGRVLCTPTGYSKGLMTPEDLCVVDMEGNKLEGPAHRKPSSEMDPETIFKVDVQNPWNQQPFPIGQKVHVRFPVQITLGIPA